MCVVSCRVMCLMWKCASLSSLFSTVFSFPFLEYFSCQRFEIGCSARQSHQMDTLPSSCLFAAFGLFLLYSRAVVAQKQTVTTRSLSSMNDITLNILS